MAKGDLTFVKPNIWSAPEVTRVANARIRPTSGSPHDRTPPTVPTSLTAVAVSDTQVDMTWGASTDPAVPGYETSGMKSYRIFRNSRKIAEVNASVLSYSATGLTPSTSYQFRVAAVDNRNNQSPQTPQKTVLMPAGPIESPDVTAPSVPANLSAVAQGETQINLSWSISTDPTVPGAETSGVVGYKVYRDSAHVVTVALVPSYQDTGLVAGTEYSYTVSAVDLAGNESAQSAAESATTTSPGLDPDTTAPSVPTGLAASAQSSSSISLTWNAATDPTVGGQETSGLAGYRVRRGGSIIASPGLVLTYLDTGLSAGTQYSYTIASRDVAGNESVQSAAQLETTTAASYYLNVTWTPATQNSDGSAIGTILSHKVYAGLASGNYTVTETVAAPATSMVLELPSGGTWYVMVTTVTALGESVASEEASRAANVS